MRPSRAGRLWRAAHTSAQQLAAPQPAPTPRAPTALPSPPLDAPRPPTPWASWIGATVDDLADRRLLRSLRAVEPVEGRPNQVRLVPQPTAGARAATSADVLIVFAANDYLGLSTHPRVRAAAAAAAAAHGCGPRSSALVCGYTGAHARLEASLARLKQAETAFLFPSGFAANTAVIGALASSPSCAIFSDALNHASIVDGARLAAKGAGGARA
jgi:8-amino-7-oxononanoate synthase